MPNPEGQPTRDRGQVSRGASATQLLEAERGLRRNLSKTFAGSWINRNAADLIADANREYIEWLDAHRPAISPVAWLIQRAQWRALDQVNRENRRPEPPLDSFAAILEDPGAGPDEMVIAGDRHRQLTDALAELAEKDRRLLALVEGEGHSITAAARLLGWGKSTAAEHHAAALDELKALLPDRDILTPKWVGALAYAMTTSAGASGVLVGGLRNRVSAAVQDVSALIGRAFGGAENVARRAAPTVTETGSAAASGGAGRFAAQCGALAIAAVCSAVVLAPIEHRNPLQVFSNPPAHQRRAQRPDGTAPPVGPVEPAPAPPQAGRSVTSVGRATAARDRQRRRERQARARQRARRIARHRRLRKAQRDRAKARASARRRALAEEREREEAAAPVEEVAPVEEAAPVEETGGAPPPATGAQVRQEVGH